ncbi:MAG: hypothetical protein M3092_02920 [Actinomycetia bacterium]|nr:hypothetical protein [Actinomycetes bacterium]
MTTKTIDDFTTDTTSKAPDRNVPQKAGRALWAPMFAMSLMGFAIGMGLAIARSNMISNGDDPLQIAAYGQYISAAMFFGFAMVFAAISFAIAKILGEFRVGGGSVQAATNSDVKTLKMPGTAKGFLVGMMMAMMIILTAVVLHVFAGIAIADGGVDPILAEQWTIWLEAARRFGTIVYLFSIMLGLITIVKVIHYQTFRLRQITHTE